MSKREDEDEIVLLEVQPGDAALLFTIDGLQAFLPEDIDEDVDLPWHLRVVGRAMAMIHDFAVEQQKLHKAGQVTTRDSFDCELEALLSYASTQVIGEA